MSTSAASNPARRIGQARKNVPTIHAAQTVVAHGSANIDRTMTGYVARKPAATPPAAQTPRPSQRSRQRIRLKKSHHTTSRTAATIGARNMAMNCTKG